MHDLSGIVKDPALYRQLSEPYESTAALTEAFMKFNEELRALREKYRIPDLVYVIVGNALNEEGEECSAITMGNAGDSTKMELMLAWALGQERDRKTKLLRALAAEPN